MTSTDVGMFGLSYGCLSLGVIRTSKWRHLLALAGTLHVLHDWSNLAFPLVAQVTCYQKHGRAQHKLNSVENRVVELENEQQILRDDIVEQNTRVDSLFSTTKSVENKIEKQEQYSRRANLVFYGILESHSESPQTPKVKLLIVLKTVLPHTNWNDRDLVRLHRTGPQTDSSYPSPVIARFQFHCDKVQVLGKRAELKSLGIGVSNDLTYKFTTKDIKLKKHREKGNSAYYKNGVLHVNEEPTHHHNQNTDCLYSEVSASSSLNAERYTQARHIARPHRRIKRATQNSERKESTRQQQQENRRSTEP
ncbi:hypothetical protein ElyMa_006515400 [Elysia marginata]|uniref:t-SNARE coiled-coil homology domain-containing protein n=1 Tax=Elysia marginata TaxID=1093978 RepID=A0AAV4I494_9GAST|nr:hypothetical protein ElyMa_006515400 [Elysia marginata]